MQRSLASFKKQAKPARVLYQRMLRVLSDAYTQKYDVAA